MSIQNGVLVDKDGHPIKHYESANYRIINHQHESFLMPVNEDGTIRWPTPEEMEPMRAKGSVRQDLSPLLGAAVDRESDWLSAQPTPNHPPPEKQPKQRVKFTH